MVNHVRTLLLNADGRPQDHGVPGEEYIPPDFRRIPLSALLTRVRRALFGSNPDRATMNWYLRELMGTLHATELADYVTAPDRRITYLPFNQDLFDQAAAGLLTRPSAGLPDMTKLLEATLSTEDLDALFGASPAEPYLTFRNCWTCHNQLPYRLGGLVLALAYRTDELRG